jgi:hypothetical protein
MIFHSIATLEMCKHWLCSGVTRDDLALLSTVTDLTITDQKLFLYPGSKFFVSFAPEHCWRIKQMPEVGADITVMMQHPKDWHIQEMRAGQLFMAGFAPIAQASHKKPALCRGNQTCAHLLPLFEKLLAQ